MKPMRIAVLMALYGAASMQTVSFAQTNPAAPAAAKSEEAQRVTVVGSRRASSSATETPLPVDVIAVSKTAETGGQFDLAQTLANISPSFNSTRQTGADGADLVDSAALRGLGSDQTLVLVNGKRRHTAALVNLFGARNRGNTGTDLNSIPVMAISNIQVLRDGAAAQYGSDAIAGVMDISLKKSLGCEAIFGYSQYSVGDGKSYLPSLYCGHQVGDNGVIGVTVEYQDRGRSNRAESGSKRTIGDSKMTGPTVYLNGEFKNGGTDKFYFTLGAQQRKASSGAWERSGVGSDDIPSRNLAAMYPNGFVPFIDAEINDVYGTGGYKWRVGEWNADVSQTYGYNKMIYNIKNTLNASIANKDLLAGGKGVSASQFDAGGFSFGQATTNLDFNRFFDTALGGINVAFGAEFRRESYQIYAGESGSYIDADGVGVGGNAGSQGFPGFQPSDVTNKSRTSWATYLDVEADVSQGAKLQGAIRAERYSDFGSTVTGKIAGSYQLSPATLVRGSVSTGFRAPSLQQVYFSSTFTDFINGNPMDVVLAPNGGKVANAAGIPNLKQETSKNYTLGLTYKPSNQFSMTADLYRIDIADRIVLSGRFDADNYPALGTTLSKLGVGQAQFFVNSIATKTQGLDLTAFHKMDLGSGKLSTSLGMNFSKTEVTKINAPTSLKGFEDVLLSERERLFIEQGGPSRKATLSFNYDQGPWSTEFKVVHYGPQTLGTFSGTANGVPNAYYEPKTSADVALTYAINASTKVTVGGNNIFNAKPTSQNPDETDNGFRYDSVQFGLGGASYFVKLWKKF